MSSSRETRAVWIEQPQDAMLSGTFNRRVVEKIIQDCKMLGANTLFWLIKARVANTSSVLWYRSDVGPYHPSCDLYDGMHDIVALAKDAGMELHAYFSVFTEGAVSGSDLARGEAILARNPEWSVVDSVGRTTEFVCAAHEGYHSYLKSLIDEILSRYALDGIHLDFVRYPRSACYCRRCVGEIERRFQISHPKAQHLLEGSALNGLSYDERGVVLDEAASLIDYYCENVHVAIGDIASHVRRNWPGRHVSAAVFPNPRAANSQVFCDWLGFAPYLDFVCPMVYWYSPEYFGRTVSRLDGLVKGKTHLFPGISAMGRTHELGARSGNYLSGSPSFEYVADLVQQTREIGTEGFALFHHATMVGEDYGPYTGATWGTPITSGSLDSYLRLVDSPTAVAHGRLSEFT